MFLPPAVNPLSPHTGLYAGLEAVLQHSTSQDHLDQYEQDYIQADMEGEQETLPDLTPADFSMTDADETSVLSQWKRTVNGASKSVADNTERGYLR